MSKILVTGGAGFIGSHVYDLLVAAGHKVFVVDNLSSGTKDNLPKDAKLHVVDIRSKEMQELIHSEGPEVIVHCAAQMSVRVSMEDPILDADINVMGLLNMLEPLRKKSGTHFVFLSTGGAIYGEQEAFPAPETHPVHPESAYGLSKFVGENYLALWAKTWGLRTSILRLANVYGPRQNPHGEAGVVAIFAKGLYQNKKLTINGAGNQTRDFVFVGDVAEAVRSSIEKGCQGTFNIGTGVETSVNDLVHEIKRATGISGNFSNGPAKGGEQMRSVIDPSLARLQLGWKPAMQLATGIDITAAWFRDQSA